MGIRAVLDNLIVIEAACAITSPVTVSVKRAYKYIPDRESALPDTPCWLNGWSLVNYLRSSAFREQEYDIRAQLAVLDADQDRAADIASALYENFLTRLDANITLGATINRHDLVGGQPTLAAMTWAGQPYIGIDMHLHVVIKEAATFS